MDVSITYRKWIVVDSRGQILDQKRQMPTETVHCF